MKTIIFSAFARQRWSRVLTLIFLSQYVFYAVAKDELGKPLAMPLDIFVKVKDINDNPPTCPPTATVFEVQENEGVGKK